MPKTITSLTNPKIKHLVRLRDRRARDQEGVFIIEGFRELAKAAQTRTAISELYVCPELFLGKNEPTLIEKLVSAGAHLFQVAEQPFRKAAYRDRPEGVLGVAPQFSTNLGQLIYTPRSLILVAEGIEKPGNLGTMLRTADAAGATAVIAADPRTDPFNPNVVRSSVGSLFTVPLAVASSLQTQNWLDENQITPIVTTPHSSLLYWEADLTGSIAVVVGSEQYGLSPSWLDQGFPTVKIPMSGQSDSLNPAMATGVILFESVRQHHQNPS